MVKWQDEVRSALKDKISLENYFNQSFPETNQPAFLPLPLAKRIKEMGANSPLGKQFLPHPNENTELGLSDPIGDFKPGPLPYFIHRYENRALFFPTTVCPVQCRYCFRKNSLHDTDINLNVSLKEIEKYLTKHTEINEIIFSGGDPFMLTESRLYEYLKFFTQFESIKYLRFHTRIPTILPSRITEELLYLLTKMEERFKLTIVIHTNHPDEFNEEVKEAIKKLKPFNLLSQSVLLKGINDNLETLINLVDTQWDLDIRPYYLHHPDQVRGGMHFYLPEEEGRDLYQKLRQKLSGWMLPQYIIDSPEAVGKQLLINKYQYLSQNTHAQT